MKIIIYLVFLLSFSFGSSLVPFGEKASSELLIYAQQQKKVLSVGLIPPTATQPEFQKENRFGLFLTNFLHTSFGKESETIKVFERQRLKAVAEELSLTMTELMEESHREQIGKIAAIDYLLVGEWTKLDTTLSITCRLVDVVTGEVSHSFSGEAFIDNDMKSLLIPQKSVVTTDNDSSTLCPKEMQIAVKVALSSLGEKGVQEATTLLQSVPLSDSICRLIHFNTLHHFSRANISPETYLEYLINQLIIEERIDRDLLAQETVAALAKDGVFSDKEWQKVLPLIALSYRPARYLSHILQPNRLTLADTTFLFPRLREWHRWIKKEKIGRPKPLTKHEGFKAIADAMLYQSVGKGESALARNKAFIKIMELFQPLENLASFSKQQQRFYYRLFYNMIIRDVKNGGGDREKISSFLITFFKAPLDKSFRGDLLLMLLQHCHNEKQNVRLSPKEQSLYHWWKEELIKSLEPIIIETFSAIKTPYKKKSAKLFALQHSIAIPHFVPSIETLGRELSGNSSMDKLRETANLLAASGKAASSVEHRVIKMVNRTTRMKDSVAAPFLGCSLMVVLQNIETESKQALEAIMLKLISPFPKEQEQAVKTLTKLGEPAQIFLLKALKERDDTNLQKGIVKSLGAMEKAAYKAQVPLKKLREKSDDLYLQDAIDDALDFIEFGE